MKNYQYLGSAIRLHHGNMSLKALEREITRAGCSRPAIVCGRSLAANQEAMSLVLLSLERLETAFLPMVEAHSPLPSVERLAGAIDDHHADCIVAFGGGSAIVSARAASILLAENRPAREMCTTRDKEGEMTSPKLLQPKLPHFVVPTTPTTAIVKAGSAMLDPKDKKRLALFDPKTRAQAVFLHPRLIATPSDELVVSAAINTLVMCLEGLCARSSCPITDAFLMHALRLIWSALSSADSTTTPQSRSDLMLAAIMCGHATDFTNVGAAIPIGHAVSAIFHVDNGSANAILLPHVLRYNASASSEGLAKAALALDLPSMLATNTLNELLEALAMLLAKVGLPSRLRDIGVSPEDLPKVASVIMEDWYIKFNPRRIETASDVEALLRSAW